METYRIIDCHVNILARLFNDVRIPNTSLSYYRKIGKLAYDLSFRILSDYGYDALTLGIYRVATNTRHCFGHVDPGHLDELINAVY